MKKGIVGCTVLILMVVFLLPSGMALAEDIVPPEKGIYCAVSDITVYKIVGTKEMPLFNIPDTYYFEIIGTNDDATFIKYGDLDNALYIKTNNYAKANESENTDTYTPFIKPLKIKDDLGSENFSFKKFDNFAFSEDSIAKTNVSSIEFIGKQKYNEKDCIFICLKTQSETSYGYIETANLATMDNQSMVDFIIPKHPNSDNPSLTPGNDKDIKDPENNLVRTILIIGIVIPAVIIIFLLFKPNGKSKNRYNYDRNVGYDYGESKYDRPRSRYDRYNHDDRYYDNDRFDDRERRDRYDDPRDYRRY